MLQGKRREFSVGLLLTIFSFGIYPCYWHYVAFRELYDQERRDDFPLALYLCCYIPFVHLICQALYMARQLEFLSEQRTRHGLGPTIGIGEFLLWVTLGHLIIVGPPIAYARLQRQINELWASYAQLPATTPRAAAAE
jgi:uncharacterized membrane protein (DUF485 family)